MTREDKKKIAKLLEFIAREATYHAGADIADIINEALELWPTILGENICMNKGLKLVGK